MSLESHPFCRAARPRGMPKRGDWSSTAEGKAPSNDPQPVIQRDDGKLVLQVAVP